MRRTLQLVAVLVIFGAAAFWTATGGNRGWTKTSVPKTIVDEVTGIESPRYEDRFVPGVDFLVASLIGAGALAGASFLFRKSQQPTERRLTT